MGKEAALRAADSPRASFAHLWSRKFSLRIFLHIIHTHTHTHTYTTQIHHSIHTHTRSKLTHKSTFTPLLPFTHGVPNKRVDQVVVGAEHNVRRLTNCPGQVVGTAVAPSSRSHQFLQVVDALHPCEGVQLVVALNAAGVQVEAAAGALLKGNYDLDS